MNYPLPSEWEVYGETENGREVREGKGPDGRTCYWVQPRDDNYWICVRTPEEALDAYHHPAKYRQAT